MSEVLDVLALAELLHAPEDISATAPRRFHMVPSRNEPEVHSSEEQHVPAVLYAQTCFPELLAVRLPELLPRLDAGQLCLRGASNGLQKGLWRRDGA